MYLADGQKIWLATTANDEKIFMLPSMANRHGLIAGATGTGKTVSLKVMAESFSDMGVPVFLADIKGDLSGMCQPGVENKHVRERVDSMHIENFEYKGFPTTFFDVFSEKGIPVRTTISEIGPDLLSRLLELNTTQSGILTIIFKIADDRGLFLIDMKDLKALVQYVGDNNKDFRSEYGNISTQSVGAIMRSLIRLEEQGGDIFFGEPSLKVMDWMVTDANGKGMINILDCVKLFQSPLLYSTFLLWMLSELYESLPEAGDLDKPKMIFFFDEAHLLFKDAPKSLLTKIEQVVRLIRSKAVGIYFITQVPTDIPDSVLSQLGNKIQHALRAYTPNDQKALKATARSFRVNPEFDCETTLGELGTGEALVSVLDEDGIPTVVQRAFMLPPMSFMNVIDDATRTGLIQNSPLYAKYSQAQDPDSAYEMLQRQTQQDAQAEALARQQAELEKEKAALEKERQKATAKKVKKTTSVVEKTVNSTLNSMGREFGRTIMRGLFGSILKK